MNGIPRQTAQFLLEAIAYFNDNPNDDKFRGVKRSEIFGLLVDIVKLDPRYINVTEVNIKEAWFVLSKVVRGEFNTTLPSELNERLVEFDNRLATSEEIKFETQKQVRSAIERQQEIYEKSKQNVQAGTQKNTQQSVAKEQSASTPQPEHPATQEEVKESKPIYKAPEIKIPKTAEEILIPKDTTVYLTTEKKVEPIKLDPQTAKSLLDDIKSAEANPTAYAESIKILLRDNTEVKNVFTSDPKKFEKVVESVSLDYTQKLLGLAQQVQDKPYNEQLIAIENITPAVNKVWMFATISDPKDPVLTQIIPNEKDRKRTVEANQGLAIREEGRRNIEVNTLGKVINNNVLNILYGQTEQVTYHLSQTPNLNSLGINLYQTQIAYLQENEREDRNPEIDINDIQRVYDWYKSLAIAETATVASPAVGTAITVGGAYAGFKTAIPFALYLQSAGIPLLPTTAVAGYLASESALTSVWTYTQGVEILTPIVPAVQTGVVSAASAMVIDVAPIIVSTGTSTAATVAGTAVVVSESVAAPVAGAVIGSAVPVIGAIVGFIAVKFLPKVIDFIKKHTKDALAVAFGMFAGGAFFGSLPLMIGGAGLGITATLVSGVSPTAAIGMGVGGIVSGFSSLLTVLVIPSIAMPILISLISIPVAVALVMFIINAGAYVVPPGGSSYLPPGSIESPYIGVTKLATPAGPFKNDDLPKKIKYKVTVIAKKGALTNISFTNTCSVINKGTNKPNCSPPLPATIPNIISPGQSFEFEYEMDYSTEFEDAFVTDIFQVKADSPEKAGATASANATIKIGSPPESCPQNAWPIGPEPGESGLTVSQGPDGSWSHLGYEAMDISATTGHSVRSTHSGIVSIPNNEPAYGRYVLVTSSCGGKTFYSLYGHLSGITVASGTQVTPGQEIGISGSTGNSTGPHLHFEFRTQSGRAGPGANNPPILDIPYVPTKIPRGCNGNCGVIIN